MTQSEQCSFCGKAAEGNHAIHRDGFSEGPEVPLCDACGGSENPTCEEIWDRISTLIWVEKPAIAALLEGYEAATFVNGRSPAWQYGIAASFAYSTIYVQALQLEFGSVFDSVASDSDLQNAVTAAVRCGAKGFEVLVMINEWQAGENHNQSGAEE